MTPLQYWLGWSLGAVVAYWVIRLAIRHEKRRDLSAFTRRR